MRAGNYDKYPTIQVPGSEGKCVRGWAAIGRRLDDVVRSRKGAKTVIAVDCYTGVDEAHVLERLLETLRPSAATFRRVAASSGWRRMSPACRGRPFGQRTRADSG